MQPAACLIPDRMLRFAGAGCDNDGRTGAARAFLHELDLLSNGGMEWDRFCEGVQALIDCSSILIERLDALLKNPSREDDDVFEFMDLLNKYTRLNEMLVGLIA